MEAGGCSGSQDRGNGSTINNLNLFLYPLRSPDLLTSWYPIPAWLFIYLDASALQTIVLLLTCSDVFLTSILRMAVITEMVLEHILAPDIGPDTRVRFPVTQ